MSTNKVDERMSRVLGSAVVKVWGELPQEVQHDLFEQAVLIGHHGIEDESLREQLARYLHDHNGRTAQR